MFSTGDGSYYVFKGGKYWKLTDDSVAAGYPRNIAEDWPGKLITIEIAGLGEFTFKLYLMSYAPSISFLHHSTIQYKATVSKLLFKSN